MIKGERKLEELIYFSLISNFESKHVKDGVTYISFCSKIQELGMNQNNKPVCKVNLRPIYLTSDEETSPRVLELRVKAFENKIFDENMKEAINQYLKNEIYFSRRIALYMNNVYFKKSEKEQKQEIANFATNLYGLYNFNIIDKQQFKLCKKYMEEFVGKKELVF